MIVLLLMLPATAWAEWYAGAYGGFSSHGDLANSTIPLSNGTLSTTDVEFDDSAVVGGKVGYFFESANWFGIEIDAGVSWPDTPTQQVGTTFTPSVSGAQVPGTATVAARDNTLILFVPSVILRYPGETWQPYAGVGPALFEFDDEASPGISVLGGLRVFVLRKVALFAEYRYRAANIEDVDLGFGAAQGNFAVNQIVFGVTLHLR